MRNLRSPRDEGGRWGLVTLIVVASMIGLALLAGPMFMRREGRANDKAAQSSVRNALVAAKTIFMNTDDYSKIGVSSMTNMEPSLTYSEGVDSAGPNEVSIGVTTTNTSSDTVVLVALDKEDACWGVQDVFAGGTTFFSAREVGGNCGAYDAVGATGTSW